MGFARSTSRFRCCATITIALASGGCDDDPSADAGVIDAGPRLNVGIVDAGVDSGASSSSFDSAGLAAAVDEFCSQPGCLRGVTYVGAFSRSFIEDAAHASVDVKNGYRVLRADFLTENDRIARLSVALPFDDVTKPTDGYPLAISAPGTVGIADACVLSRTVAGDGLAGSFGARGFIAGALDYPGLDTPGAHPYLVSSSEGAAVLDGLRALKRIAHASGTPTNEACVAAGLSQGGHAVLAAAARHEAYAPDLDVRGFSVAAPASVYLEHWSAGAHIDGAHLVYHALLLHTFTNVYDEQKPVFHASLAGGIAETLNSTCLFAAVPTPTLFAVLPAAASEMFDATFLEAYRETRLSSYAGISAGFAANRVVPFVQTAPIRIYQGTGDTTVLASHTTTLVDDLRDGGMTVEYVVVDGGGHTDIAFSFLADEQSHMESAAHWLKVLTTD